jgi:DNA-binding NarL/FixJ family response regulator
MLVKIMNLAVWLKPGLFTDGLLAFIQSEKFCSLKCAADNASGFLKSLRSKKDAIEIAIIDEYAPGFDTDIMHKIKSDFKKIKLLLIGTGDISRTFKVIPMGADGYISKDSDRDYFLNVLKQMRETGHYYGDHILRKSMKTVFKGYNFELNNNEMRFVELCCEELTYPEMAGIMNVSPRTIDDYRNKLFEKLKIKSRTGLVIFAISQGIVSVKDKDYRDV